MQQDQNLYAAPVARIVETSALGTAGRIVERPNKVSAGRGAAWLGEGWRLVKRAPLTWIALCMAWAVLAVAVSLVPLLNIASSLLFFPIFGGILLGAQTQAEGGKLRFACLFDGLRANPGGLFGLALLMVVVGIVFSLIYLAVMGLALGGGFVSWMLGAMAGHAGAPPENFREGLGLFFVVSLLLSVIGMVVYGAGAIATALVAIHRHPVWAALKLGLAASFSNIGAWLVFGACAFLMMIVASIPLGLGLLVVLPVFMAACYAAYRDLLTT